MMEEEQEQQVIVMPVRERPNILVAGTPGVGKTTFSALLAEYVQGFTHVNLGSVINEQKLYTTWNEEFNVPEFDEDKVCDYLEPHMQQGGMIVDFHTTNFFPERWFDIVILLRCSNTQLFDRLQARGYSQSKIDVNIESEILEVTSEDVYSSYKKEIICELKNEAENQMEQNIQTVIQGLQNWKQQQQMQQQQQQ